MTNNIKKELKELKNNTNNELKKYVIDYILENEYNSDKEIYNFINNLLTHGCQSGMVGGLISYNDTVEFYEKYKYEINNLLYELLENTGLSIQKLFGKKWDNEDPLVNERFNQNLLAWFGFEETARNIWEQDLNQEL